MQPTQKTRIWLYSQLRRISTILIALSILSTVIIFTPIIVEELRYRFNPNHTTTNNSISFSISIPDISIHTSMSKNIDPWNKNEYTQALKNGPAHAAGSALPGESGTVYIFAHSSGNPWEMTYINTPFYRLNKLDKNNIITLYYHGTQYQYLVSEKLVVDPHQTQYLLDQSKDQLILQTCWPLGTDWQRLLVIAEPF